MEEQEKNKLIDDEHLRLLALGHLIDGCVTVVFSCFFIIHFIFLTFIANKIETFSQGIASPPQMPPTEIFQLLAYILGAFILFGILYGVSKIVSYRFIKQRKYRMFSYVVAIPGLLFVPYGTILGVATIMVLGRSSVKKQYDTELLQKSGHFGQSY